MLLELEQKKVIIAQIGKFHLSYATCALRFFSPFLVQGVENYRIAKLADDIAGVIRSLGVPQVVLMAHDWGGAVCWHVAHLYPNLLSQLIIACAPHPKIFSKNMDWNQFLRSWYVFLFQVPMIPELGLWARDFALVDEMFTKPPMGVRRPGAMTQEDIEGYKKELARPGALTSALNYYRGVVVDSSYGMGPEMTEALRQKLTVPTLCIWADADVALGPQLLQGLEKYVENLRVVTLEDCSHWAQQDRPEEFNAAVWQFLKE